MTLRRGFKKEANDYAREFRKELGLAAHDPLCPWQLAEHLAIPVVPMSEFAAVMAAEHLAYFSGSGQSVFSAATVFHGTRRLIVHNDNHHPNRQAANLAHELAHGILGHPPSPPLDDHGCRNFDRTIEDEANWLGPALLISEEAAMHIVETGMTHARATQVYKVSRDLLLMRLGVCGAERRVARRRARW
ncbi:ImmA/IrrE family metallo-endopeptidase [Azospirillum himalayense]|uniref:ImmA/IrrE family metallo-endopeptidase n=1 Tax=Azospirillum himalayense TaxID=654847 RepID=A0ABW0G8A4_9PROT